MTATGKLDGRPIEWNGKEWHYTDDNTLVEGWDDIHRVGYEEPDQYRMD